MTILNARARRAVLFARAADALLPAPPPVEDRPGDADLVASWEALVLETATRIVAVVGNDRAALVQSIGPEIEVGRNPSWRVLLQLALHALEASPRAGDTHPGSVLSA